MNETLKNTQPKIIVFGRITRDSGNPSRLEIAVARKGEYNKSPLSNRHRTGPRGDRVVAVHDTERCEASVHDYPNRHEFYIGNASWRLEDPVYTALFHEFMVKAGLAKQGIKVKLVFIHYDTEYKISVSKA